MNKIDLFIAGVQKSGSTSLYQYLVQHPDLLSHPQKEMTFFYNDDEYAQGYESAFQRYFHNASEVEYKKVMAKHILVLSSRKALDRLWAHNPESKLVVVLRDPISRAYSAYWYARRLGREGRTTFEQAIADEIKKIYTGAENNLDMAYLYGGQYSDHLRYAMSLFPRESIHVYTTDRLRNFATQICNDLFASIKLCPHPVQATYTHNEFAMARSEYLAKAFDAFMRSKLRKAIRRCLPDRLSYRMRYAFWALNEKKAPQPPMKLETRLMLQEYFSSYNRELAQMLEVNEDELWSSSSNKSVQNSI